MVKNLQNMTSSEYIQWLLAKGIQCKQEETCNGCPAFSPYTKDRIQEWGWDISVDELRQLHKRGVCCACGLEFPQAWGESLEFSPISPCPKPKTSAALIECLSSNSKVIQGRSYLGCRTASHAQTARDQAEMDKQ